MKKSHWGDKNAAGPEVESGTVRIEDLMADRVAVLTRHQTVGHARKLMSELGIHCLNDSIAEHCANEHCSGAK